MPINKDQYLSIKEQLDEKGVVLVAVSKIQSVKDILALYDLGQRDFGENYVQELVEKEAVLPKDIRWHFIGHLQTNKVKYLAPFVHLIHSVDSIKLLKEIDKQAQKAGRVQDALLQLHIASEETKFGFSETELEETADQLANASLQNVKIKGLMGMASFTENQEQIIMEFKKVNRVTKTLSALIEKPPILSFGMSSDYPIAIKEGSTMVRIGSLLFGSRERKG